MIRLIAWCVAIYALYQAWKGARLRQHGGRDDAHSAPAGHRSSPIDRSNVVDAEFTEVDAPGENDP